MHGKRGQRVGVAIDGLGCATGIVATVGLSGEGLDVVNQVRG